MKIPLQISFEGLPHSAALEDAAHKRAEKLARFSTDIIGCRVSIGLPEKHKHQGNLYSVRVDLTVPGHEVVSTRERNEDAYVALRDAFDNAERVLRETIQKDRDSVQSAGGRASRSAA